MLFVLVPLIYVADKENHEKQQENRVQGSQDI